MTSCLPPRPHRWVPGKPESHQSCSGNSRSVWSLCRAFLSSSITPENFSTTALPTRNSPNNGWKLPAPISCRALTLACASQGLSLDFSFELCKRKERGETFQASERGQGRCVQARGATRPCWLADVTCHMRAPGGSPAQREASCTDSHQADSSRTSVKLHPQLGVLLPLCTLSSTPPLPSSSQHPSPCMLRLPFTSWGSGVIRGCEWPSCLGRSQAPGQATTEWGCRLRPQC